jgi:WD40 repeat protein
MTRLGHLFLAVAVASVAGAANTLHDLAAAQKARAKAMEENLRSVGQSCGPDRAKGREAGLLYRKAMARTNELLDALAQGLGEGRAPDAALVQEAEAANLQLRAYLDLARCDGTTAAPGEGEAPRAVLPSLVRQALEDAGAGQAMRQRVTVELAGLRWQPETVPGPAGARSKGVDPGAQGPAPRYLILKGLFHTAPIRQMAMDARETVLVTASEDKTLRVWEPRTLACLRVLRPPVGPGDCGKLYAVALSPDGHTVVASGFTRDPEGGGHRLYVMDVRDGRLIREIPGLPQVVNRLSLSPDGATVVVHLGERMGLRRYRLADGAEVGRDPLFGGPSYAGAFAADGRFAATSEDGFIRVYGPDFHLLAKARTPGKSPFGVAFSPDGTTLALGYADGVRVDLLSAKTLFPAGKVDTAGCAGPLGIVAWSRDGRSLFACGGEDFGPRPNAVYRWTDGGKGPRMQTNLADATLCDLLPLKDGGLLVAAQDPRLCRLNPDLSVAVALATVPGSLAQAREGLRVDASGNAVALGWRFPGRAGCSFSLAALGLQDGAGGLVGPLLESAGMQVGEWKDGEHPSLNGAPLQGLEPHEVVRSLSLARNAQGFALGTDWCLRLFDARGRLMQTVGLPAACWGLNHTPDGKTIVAALADGTLRWYHASDGRELMALTLAPDGQRWVLWNPEGYYSPSVGGEAILGWEVQREGEAGDFFPLHQFRDPYCQPGLFPALLARGELDPALGDLGLAKVGGTGHAQQAELAMPPVLRILEPREGSVVTPGMTTFRVRVRTSGPAERVRAWHLYVDGEKRPDPQVLAEEGLEQYRLEVPLPPHGCRVSLVMEAETRVSEPAQVNLVEPGQALPARPPALNLLAVGISAYRQGGLTLAYPAKDARDVVALFQRQRNGLYSKVNARTLVDGEATRANILAALREVRDQSSPWDVTLFFLSGHGVANPGTGSYCFLPVNADPHDEATLVDGRDLREILGRTQGKVVLMLDTCHSGSVLGEGRMRGLDEAVKLTRFINELTSAANGVMVFSSSTGRQLSLEAPDWGNGAFTKALREGLAGKADPDQSGRVTLGQLDTWLRTRVKELTQGTQTPVTARPATALDFPLVILQP